MVFIHMKSQPTRNSSASNTIPPMYQLTAQDYLDLKKELKSRIIRLVPEIVQSAYFYGSIVTGDVSPGLSDPDVYVVLKTEKGELPRHILKRLFHELWDLAIHPLYNRAWGVHWIHFDTDANVDKTLSNPLALLTFLYRSEFIAGRELSLPKPDYDKILSWMREFMAPADEKKQLENWLLSTRVIQGPKGLFYLLDSTIFHLGAWVAIARHKFPKTHSESYKLLVNAVPSSEDYVIKIAEIRENWYENNDFEKILDVYLEGIERIPTIERELVEALHK
jgi:predicted nucleotidyltransferase